MENDEWKNKNEGGSTPRCCEEWDNILLSLNYAKDLLVKKTRLHSCFQLSVNKLAHSLEVAMVTCTEQNYGF